MRHRICRRVSQYENGKIQQYVVKLCRCGGYIAPKKGIHKNCINFQCQGKEKHCLDVQIPHGCN